MPAQEPEEQKNPTAHLKDAASAVRAFNHSSQHPTDRWNLPAHSYRALGALATLTHRPDLGHVSWVSEDAGR